MFGHGGADEGFQASASASLDRGYGVIVMANSDNGFQLFPEIERTVFAAMQWHGAEEPIVRVALTEAQRDRMVGSFTNEDGLPFSLSPSGDGLSLLLPFSEAVPVVPVSTDSLVRTDDGIIMTFTGDDELALARRGDEPFTKATRLAASVRLPLLELAAGRFDDAVTVWKDLLRADAKSPLASEDVHNIFGYRLLSDGKVDAAVDVFRAIVAVFPGSSNAYDSLGDGLMAKGDNPAAITAYETAIAKLDADAAIPAEEKPARKKHAEDMLAKLRAR
jgi:tetratricopeptide (TPR) repeat protein